MKKIFIILIVSIIFAGCHITIKEYDYSIYKKYLNNKWTKVSPYTYNKIDQICFDASPVNNNKKVSKTSSIMIYESEDANGKNHKIYFKDNIKIYYKGKMYIINKNNIKFTQNNFGKFHNQFLILKDLGIKINDDFILEIGNMEVNGKNKYIPPLMFRKSLLIYKGNWVLEGPNEYLYGGWADEYKGK